MKTIVDFIKRHEILYQSTLGIKVLFRKSTKPFVAKLKINKDTTSSNSLKTIPKQNVVCDIMVEKKLFGLFTRWVNVGQLYIDEDRMVVAISDYKSLPIAKYSSVMDGLYWNFVYQLDYSFGENCKVVIPPNWLCLMWIKP